MPVIGARTLAYQDDLIPRSTCEPSDLRSRLSFLFGRCIWFLLSWSSSSCIAIVTIDSYTCTASLYVLFCCHHYPHPPSHHLALYPASTSTFTHDYLHRLSLRSCGSPQPVLHAHVQLPLRYDLCPHFTITPSRHHVPRATAAPSLWWLRCIEDEKKRRASSVLLYLFTLYDHRRLTMIHCLCL